MPTKETRHCGPVPSMPHIDMTVQMLGECGVTVERPDAQTWRVPPSTIRAIDREVEPDLSNAAAFLAAAAVTGGAVSVPRWPATTTQPGAQIVDILAEMGCAIELSDGEKELALELVGVGDVRLLRVVGAHRVTHPLLVP